MSAGSSAIVGVERPITPLAAQCNCCGTTVCLAAETRLRSSLLAALGSGAGFSN